MNIFPFRLARRLTLLFIAALFMCTAALADEQYPVYGFIADITDGASAEEEYDPLQAGFTLSSRELLQAGEYQAAVALRNQGDDVICDVTLLDTFDNVLWGPHDFDLSEGYTWRGALDITDDMLEAGVATCKVSYVLAKGDPEYETTMEKLLFAQIERVDAKPQLEFSRSQSMTYAQSGQDVTITYTVKNTGNVPLTDIVISDALFGTVQQLDALDVGEKQTFSRRITMGSAAVTSAPSVTYSSEGSQSTTTQQIAPSTIRIAQPNLEVSLESDATLVKPGDTIMLRCRLTNNGNVGYSKIQISDQILGDLGFVDDLKPGRDTVYAKSVRIQARTTFKFTITAKDTTGSDVTAVSNSLTVDIVDESDKESIALSALSNKSQVASGENVVFTLTLSNNGTEDISDITLSERSHGAINHVELLKAGEVRTFSVGYAVTGYEIFTFTATMTQQDGARREALSEPISISIGAPAETPEPSPEPSAEPTATVSPATIRAYDELLQRIMTYVSAFTVCIVIVLLVVMFAISSRDRERRRKAAQRRAHARQPKSDVILEPLQEREEDVRIYKPQRSIDVRPAAPAKAEVQSPDAVRDAISDSELAELDDHIERIDPAESARQRAGRHSKRAE